MRWLALSIAVLLATAASAQQYRIISRDQLDSVANPVAAPGSPMRFEPVRIEAGTLGEDDAPAEYGYRWRNCGERPLAITHVSADCGCVTVKFDRTPVGKDEEGMIRVTFRPKGHPGPFERRISVFTSFSKSPSAVLVLAGDVTPSAMPLYGYRHAFGPLRLKQVRVQMDSTKACIERIEVLNAGTRPLHLTADGPDYVTVRCEPETTGPGEKADLEISFDPAKAETLRSGGFPEKLTIPLDGLPLPPEERLIEIYFGTMPEEDNETKN